CLWSRGPLYGPPVAKLENLRLQVAGDRLALLITAGSQLSGRFRAADHAKLGLAHAVNAGQKLGIATLGALFLIWSVVIVRVEHLSSAVPVSGHGTREP